jgi:hypothetical protein
MFAKLQLSMKGTIDFKQDGEKRCDGDGQELTYKTRALGDKTSGRRTNANLRPTFLFYRSVSSSLALKAFRNKCISPIILLVVVAYLRCIYPSVSYCFYWMIQFSAFNFFSMLKTKKSAFFSAGSSREK